MVAEAATSIHARAFVDEHAPDAIVMDVELPDRGGLSLIEDLAPTMTVLVLTNALSYRRRCLMLGAHAFLDKSAEFGSVAETLLGNH